MQAIEFQNVRFFYASNEENGRVIKTVVLNDLDFTVEQGSFVALLGRNGSGFETYVGQGDRFRNGYVG